MIDSRRGLQGLLPFWGWLAIGAIAGWLGAGSSGTRILAQTGANQSRQLSGLQFQMTGTPGQTQWLTVVNPESQALAVYRFEPDNPRGSLKLEAVRQIRWDMMLSEYQNQPPEVSAVESMTRNARSKP
jgi:hypothetical protein